MVRVSVVLPVYNEEIAIIPAMEQIERQTFKDRELIVVDDGSTDGTCGMAANWAKGKPDSYIIKTEHLGPSHARNAGVRAARGDILFFAESDCTYSPEYINLAVVKLDEDKDSGGVCLTGAPMTSRVTLATECIEIENKLQHRLLNEGKIKPFYAWVFRKEAFLSVGGFDESLFQGEDKDLFRRFGDAGQKISWIPGVHWWHKRDQTTWTLARKWISRGRSRVRFVLKHAMMRDLAKTVLPLFLTIAGIVLLFVYPLIGAALLTIVGLAFLAKSLRVTVKTWGEVKTRRAFLGYPFFIAVRNFSTCVGYIVGMAIPYEPANTGRASSARGKP